MASLHVTEYVLKELYGHEVLMLEAYTEQLKQIPLGNVRDTIQRIHDDEVRHCAAFERLMGELGMVYDARGKVRPRAWNCGNPSELKEALEWDQHMEEKLEGVYMEQLGKADITEGAKETINEVMRETHAHSELLKALLSEM